MRAAAAVAASVGPRVAALPPWVRGLPAAWVLTRLLVLVLMFGPEHRVLSDIGYFSRSLHHLSANGFAGTMREYPLPGLGVVAVPWLLARAVHVTAAFGLYFVLSVLLVDAAFTGLLARGTDRRRAVLDVWLASAPAMGGMTYARFDLVPGVLVGCVLLLSATRPRTAALCIALATSIKLWPGLLVATVLGRTRPWRSATSVVTVVGAVAIGVTALLGGWGRVVSPLVYQRDRGLQIESVTATPAMAAWLLRPGDYRVLFSNYRAVEVTGPGTRVLLAVSTVATLALVGCLALLWLRMARSGVRVNSDALVWSCLAATLGFMCVGKVLSPQYFLWLLPMAAAGLAVVERTSRELLHWTVGLLLVTAMSQALYPWLYGALLIHGAGSGPAVGVLVVRNLAALLLLVLAVRQALRSSVATPNAAPGESRTRTPSVSS
ncbi:MAG: glycosyltransferase family 87 protein [Nocardioidaceae bacterium]